MKSHNEDKKEIEKKDIEDNKDNQSKDRFYCKVCECTMNDNAAYIDHTNGIKHNRMLGRTMQVEKSTVSKVREKLLNHKRPVEKPLYTYGNTM